jgi:hypothetical protein
VALFPHRRAEVQGNWHCKILLADLPGRTGKIKKIICSWHNNLRQDKSESVSYRPGEYEKEGERKKAEDNGHWPLTLVRRSRYLSRVLYFEFTGNIKNRERSLKAALTWYYLALSYLSSGLDLVLFDLFDSDAWFIVQDQFPLFYSNSPERII